MAEKTPAAAGPAVIDPEVVERLILEGDPGDESDAPEVEEEPEKAVRAHLDSVAPLGPLLGVGPSPPGALSKSEARVAIASTLAQAATWRLHLETLSARLQPGQVRSAVEASQRQVGLGYNSLAAAAGLLALEER